jgi:hypothetical protein
MWSSISTPGVYMHGLSQLFHIDYEPFFSFSFFFLVSLYEVIVSTSFKVEAFNDIHNITSKVEMILFQFEVAYTREI